MTRHRTRYGGKERSDLALVIDCSDLQRSAAFWCVALGYVEAPGSSPTYLSLLPARGIGLELLLQAVPDRKSHKNRLHLDLRVDDIEAEVDRLTGLGARRLTDEPIEENGWVWHVLADPDDNELCVLRPPPDIGTEVACEPHTTTARSAGPGDEVEDPVPLGNQEIALITREGGEPSMFESRRGGVN